MKLTPKIAMDLVDQVIKDPSLISQKRDFIGRSVQFLKEVNLSIPFNQHIQEVEQLINQHDQNIQTILEKITHVNINDLDNVTIYNNHGQLFLDILSYEASNWQKLIFKIKHFFKNNSHLLLVAYNSAFKIAQEKPEFQACIDQSLVTLCKLKDSYDEFYKSKSTIKIHAGILQAIDQILDDKMSVEQEQKIKEELIQESQDDLENIKDSDKLTNLTGLAMAPSLALKREKVFLNSSNTSIGSTVYEYQILKQMLEEVTLPNTEKQMLQDYLVDLERSLDLNHCLFHISTLLDSDPNYLRIVSKMAYEKVLSLKEGQSILMDTGYTGHSMRLQFLKKGDQIEITLFDTSGRLEILLSNKLLTSLGRYFTQRKGYIALKTQISLEGFKAKGRGYLGQLITLDMAKTDDFLKKASFISRYRYFINVFRSINNKKTLVTRQTLQKSGNCFAQRIRACERHCLGLNLYKKVRKYTLEKVYDDLLELASKRLNPEQIANLKKLERGVLTKKEFTESRAVLIRIKQYPTDEKYWIHIIKVLNHNIAKQDLPKQRKVVRA